MRADVAKLLLLDEPFKGVSPGEASRMLAALGAQARATGQVGTGTRQYLYTAHSITCLYLFAPTSPSPCVFRPSLATLKRGGEDLKVARHALKILLLVPALVSHAHTRMLPYHSLDLVFCGPGGAGGEPGAVDREMGRCERVLRGGERVGGRSMGRLARERGLLRCRCPRARYFLRTGSGFQAGNSRARCCS